jgi:hypothetical protein
VDEHEVVLVGGADHADDELELVDVVLARKQRLARQELRKDAPHGPHVDGGRVLLLGEQQLGGPVPPRDHVLRHEALLAAGARQAEVADLEVAAGIQEKVAGLQVAVEDVRGVHVLQAPEELQEWGRGGSGEERANCGRVCAAPGAKANLCLCKSFLKVRSMGPKGALLGCLQGFCGGKVSQGYKSWGNSESARESRNNGSLVLVDNTQWNLLRRVVLHWRLLPTSQPQTSCCTRSLA